MTNEKKDGILIRYNEAIKALNYDMEDDENNTYEMDDIHMSLEDIPVLLEALNEEEQWKNKYIDGLHKWKAEAENYKKAFQRESNRVKALERAIKSVGGFASCSTCNSNEWNVQLGCLKSGCTRFNDFQNWKFDEAKFTKAGETIDG